MVPVPEVPEVPDWRSAYADLCTARGFRGNTLWLPVAGKAAGHGGYTRLFPRDTFTSCFLFGDGFRGSAGEESPLLLEAALQYFASQQGRKPDPLTAEEPGKILHELEGVPLRGRNTLFAACDTTALFLIACVRYAQTAVVGGEERRSAEVWRYLKPRMAAAMVYLRAHIEDGLFREDTRHSGADRFALLATYWRDGGIPGRPERKLRYPAAFLLVQAQVIAALRSVLGLTRLGLFDEEEERLIGELNAAVSAFRFFFDRQDQPVAVAWDWDREGGAFAPIVFLSTDAAHALYYLEPGDVSEAYLASCEAMLSRLETPWGWKTWERDLRIPGMDRESLSRKRDLEHVWPWEHAFIAEGLRRHGLADRLEVAFRPARFLASSETPFAEFLVLRRGKAVASGCALQLWTTAYWAWVERQLSASSPA